jgi:signal transduction histidine kinase
MGKAEKKDPALTLAELAHELRQPLTGIRTSAELLLESHGDDPAVRARAAAIVQQVQRIQLLIDRARQKGPPLREGRGDVKQALEAAWSLLERDAGSQGTVLERNLAPGVAGVRLDQLSLEQILGNLLRNALEAMAGKRGRIRVSATSLSGAVEVIVEDDGPGVRDDLRPRLFRPFTTGRPSGTGLGLHISRSLAEEAGGALDLLENAPGARFRLRLPAAP